MSFATLEAALVRPLHALFGRPSFGSNAESTPLTRISGIAIEAAVTYRRMRDGDLEQTIALLARGFPERSVLYWRRALGRLRDRSVPDTYPRYGYVLTAADRVVGVLLLIVSRSDGGDLRGNVSSWYVEPPYRPYSGLLLAAPMRLKGFTLVNISAAPGTVETIVAQGFSPYAQGTFHAPIALAPPVRGVRIRVIRADTRDASVLLRDHAAMGCLAFEVVCNGEAHPFVFAPIRAFKGRVPSAQLLYCRDIETFIQFAGPLGRRLARHGRWSVMLDANTPVDGLVGRYSPGKRVKYFRGPSAPRLGDLSYTELALFGG